MGLGPTGRGGKVDGKDGGDSGIRESGDGWSSNAFQLAHNIVISFSYMTCSGLVHNFDNWFLTYS